MTCRAAGTVDADPAGTGSAAHPFSVGTSIIAVLWPDADTAAAILGRPWRDDQSSGACEAPKTTARSVTRVATTPPAIQRSALNRHWLKEDPAVVRVLALASVCHRDPARLVGKFLPLPRGSWRNWKLRVRSQSFACEQLSLSCLMNYQAASVGVHCLQCHSAPFLGTSSPGVEEAWLVFALGRRS